VLLVTLLRHSMKRLLLSTLVAAIPIISGCHKAPGQNQTELPSATVHAQTVERKSRAATEDVVGTVRPKLSAAIEAKVSGRIEQMLVVPGSSSLTRTKFNRAWIKPPLRGNRPRAT